MDDKTLTALQGSIAKWQAIVDGTGLDEGSDNCPLCKEFADIEDHDAESGCQGCPVSDETGRDGCGGTPYEKWGEYLYDNDRIVGSKNRKVFDGVSAALAQSELDFLKSLLPSSQSAAHGASTKGKP